MIARIETQFHLPAERTEIQSDRHYQSTETPNVLAAPWRASASLGRHSTWKPLSRSLQTAQSAEQMSSTGLLT
jgi:hypothetical protein